MEDEAEENPIALDFQQDREAFYIKDPKKALQGFFDREGVCDCGSGCDSKLLTLTAVLLPKAVTFA